MSNRLGILQSFGGARLQKIGDPSAIDDAVNKRFIRYDWPTGCTGKPAASEAFPPLLVPTVFTLPIDLSGSLARTITAPTASATWSLNRIPFNSNTAATIATLNFAAGAFTGTFIMASAITLAVYDILYWVGPSTQDTTMSDIAILVAGNR